MENKPKTKPIFIVKKYFNNKADINYFQKNVYEEICQNLKNKFIDYHVLFVINVNPDLKEEFYFECFYPDKLDEKDFEEFKKQTLEEIKNGREKIK